MTAAAEKIEAVAAAAVICEQATAPLQQVGRGDSWDAVAGAVVAVIAVEEIQPSCCASAHRNQVHGRQTLPVCDVAADVAAAAAAAVPEIWHAV